MRGLSQACSYPTHFIEAPSLPYTLTTPNHFSSPLVYLRTAWERFPRRKILGKRSIQALETGSGLGRLEIPEYRISKICPKVGEAGSRWPGRYQEVLRTHCTVEKVCQSQRRAEEEASDAHSPVQGSLSPSSVRPTCSVSERLFSSSQMSS